MIDELEPAWELEPVAELEPAVPVPASATPALPALPDVNIRLLLTFVPDVRVKQRLEQQARQLEAVDPSTDEGFAALDHGLANLKEDIKRTVEMFEPACSLANVLHKRFTGLRGDFTKTADEVAAKAATRLYDATKARAKAAEDATRKAQEEANAKAQATARQAVEAAKAQGASPTVIDALQRRAATATAAIVPVSTPVAPSRNAGVARWKARLKGWTGADPNPGLDMLDEQQLEQVRRLMLACTRGEVPMVAFDINWSYLNKRANSDKTTFDVPEVEAFDSGGMRATRRR